MIPNAYTIDIVGLGSMGGNLAMQALEKGLHVVGLTNKDAPPELVEGAMCIWAHRARATWN
ncbi:MAG: hypothetical protein HC876_04345 [Chloroflexaceae bacterium]|nr:hypothetical protein [Chloroflexaceae bacterium]NJO04812.1 hypothetical protein [Chloroflexaceae bacterium]